MANWAPLRALLARVDDTLTISWDELELLVGRLPHSAYEYPAFWKGDRSAWRGFTTTVVRVGESVTFVRRGRVAPDDHRDSTPEHRPSEHHPSPPDVVLVGCVKRKLPQAAPAKDLYDSALFRRERAYAEKSGAPWFVLSAEHGLVDPESVIEPYDRRLTKSDQRYRQAWGARVADQLAQEYGDVAGRVIEIHAGAAYADAVRPHLIAGGAQVFEPLRGLNMGRRLAWYGGAATSQPAPDVGSDVAVSDIVAILGSDRSSASPAALLASGGDGLRRPGLYSWWVDEDGAQDLSRGLGEHVSSGLIYAGLAGATRRRSGRKSTNTLWGRIKGMHLGGRHQFSTFRLSLGSVLAAASGNSEIDEPALTAWMHVHLRVVTVVVDDADTLDELETRVLSALDPPLNLSKLAKTPVRLRLSELRKRYGR